MCVYVKPELNSWIIELFAGEYCFYLLELIGFSCSSGRDYNLNVSLCIPVFWFRILRPLYGVNSWRISVFLVMERAEGERERNKCFFGY